MTNALPPRGNADDNVDDVAIDVGGADAGVCRFLGENYPDGAVIEWSGQQFVCHAPDWIPVE